MRLDENARREIDIGSEDAIATPVSVKDAQSRAFSRTCEWLRRGDEEVSLTQESAIAQVTQGAPDCLEPHELSGQWAGQLRAIWNGSSTGEERDLEFLGGHCRARWRHLAQSGAEDDPSSA
jgi:hypothetical protein